MAEDFFEFSNIDLSQEIYLPIREKIPERFKKFYDPNKISKEMQDYWDEEAKLKRKKYYEDWREKFKEENGYYPAEIDYEQSVSRGKRSVNEALEGWVPYGGIRNNLWNSFYPKEIRHVRRTLQREHELSDSFLDYMYGEDEKRRKRLSPEQLAMEFTYGGVKPGNRTIRGIEQFMMGALNKVSFGLTNFQDEIYGEEMRNEMQNWYSWGQTIGGLLQYMTVMKFAQLSGLPQLIYSKAKSTEGIKLFKTAVNLMGKGKFRLDKIDTMTGSIFKATGIANKFNALRPVVGRVRPLIKYIDVTQAGAQGMTAGLMGALMNGIEHTVDTFIKQDELTKKEWYKALPAYLGGLGRRGLEGFFQKYFVGVINDPSNWGLRFLGDAIYSMGAQSYRLLTGQQDQWSWGEYAKDAVIGHVMGEVQGKIFRASRDQIERAKRNGKAWEYGKRIDDITKYKLSDTEVFINGAVIESDDYRSIVERGRPLTRVELDKAIENHRILLNDGGHELWEAVDGKLDSFEIRPPDFIKQFKVNEDEAVRVLKEDYGFRQSEIEEFSKRYVASEGNFNKFAETFKDLNKVEKEKITKAETYDQYLKNLDNIGEIELRELYNTFDRRLKNLDIINPKTKESLSFDDVLIDKTQLLKGVPKGTDEIKPAKETTTPPSVKAISPKEQKSIDKINEEFLDDIVYNKKEQTKIVNSIIKKGVSREDANDILQDVFEKFLVKINQRKSEFINDVSEAGVKKYFQGMINLTHKERLRGKQINKQKVQTESLNQKFEDSAIEKIANLRAEDYTTPTDKVAREKKGVYSMLNFYALKKKANVKPAVAWYLQNELGYTRKEIIDLFNDIGIKTNIESLKKWLKSFNDFFKDVAISGEVGRKAPKVRRKLKYTPAEIKQIFNEFEKVRNGINPITGIRKDIDTFTLSKVKKGAITISVDDYYDFVKRYNEDVAKQVIGKAGDLIEKKVIQINAEWFPRRRNARLYVTNPTDYNSTKFVIYQDNLTPREFNRAVTSIIGLLRNNTDEAIQAGQGYAVLISRTEDRGDVITNFGNINISYTTRKNVLGESERHRAILQLTKNISPQIYDDFQQGFFNQKSSRLIEELNNIIKLTPVSNERWIKQFNALKDPEKSRVLEIITDLSKEIVPLDYEINPDVLLNITKDTPDILNREEIRQNVHRADNMRRPSFESTTEKVLNDLGLDDTATKIILKGFANAEDSIANSTIRTFWRSLKKYATEAFTVFENKELTKEYTPLVQKLYKIASSIEKYGYIARDKVLEAHGDFRVPFINVNGIEAYRYLMQFIMEEEKNTLLKLKPKELDKPIQFKSKREIDLEFLRDKPKELLKDELIVRLFNHAKNDEIPFSKILVQYFGVPADKLQQVIERLDVQIMRPLEDMYISNLMGDTCNQNVFERNRNELEKTVKVTLSRQLTKQVKDPVQKKRLRDRINRLVLDEKGKQAEVYDLIDRIQDENWKGRTNRAYNSYLTIDPEKLSYFTHLVLQSPYNRKKFFGQIQDYIKKGTTYGARVLNPFMKELTGRKVATFRQLLEAGYKVERDSVNVLAGVLKYMHEKSANLAMAVNFKEQFLTDFETAYRLAKEKDDINYLYNFFRESVGYFYDPQSDFKMVTKKIGEIENEIKNHTSEKYTGLFKKFRKPTKEDVIDDFVINKREQLKGLKKEKARLKKLWDVYKGQDEEMGIGEVERKEIANMIRAEQEFLPMNIESYDQRNRGEMTELYDGVKRNIGRIKGLNLTRWNGLYFSRLLHKDFKNVVFRNDFLNNEYDYDWQRIALRWYDKANSAFKAIRFYKPSIIIMNDLVQGLIANPLYVKNVKLGFQAFFNKFDRSRDKEFDEVKNKFNVTRNSDELMGFLKKNPGYFYNIMNDNNLYNKAVATSDLYSSAVDASLRLMGKKGFFGALMDNISRTEGFGHKILSGMRFGWKGWQSITWNADEIIRTMVAKTMFDRFIKVHDFDRASFLSAEWTNLFLVKYSRLPMHTRQWLNRLFLVPTYRIQSLRMYKEMFRMAGRGVREVIGRTPEERFKVSENRMEQAMFEIGPLARALAMQAGFKILLAQIFGYEYEDPFDLMTSYRLKKFKGKGLLDAEMEFLSLSTPVYELQRHFTRLRRAPRGWLRYQLASMPGFAWCLWFNENLITGKKMWTSDNSFKALQQIGMNMLTMYTPIGSEYMNWGRDDVNLAKKIFSFFGLGFAYNIKNPQQVLRDFEEAIDKTKSPQEHRKLLKEFQIKFNRAYQGLMNEKFRTLEKELEAQRKALGG
jgi:hypothetical protein